MDAVEYNFGEGDLEAMARQGNEAVLCTEILADLLTPLAAFLRVADMDEQSFLLESVEAGVSLARYSFLGSRAARVYRIRQGRDWKELLADLDTPARRRRYVRDFYEHRLLASPGSFEEDDFDFMVEPFEDARRLAASWAPYQLAAGRRAASELPRLMERVETLTLVLWGPEDHVLSDDFVSRCELAFPNRIGPLVVPCAGHFLQWERADIFNATLSGCFRDLVLGR